MYGHATGRDIPEALDRYEDHLEQGCQAIRIQCGVPNMRSVYGVSKGNGMYEPATKGAVEEQSWSAEKVSRLRAEAFRSRGSRYIDRLPHIGLAKPVPSHAQGHLRTQPGPGEFSLLFCPVVADNARKST